MGWVFGAFSLTYALFQAPWGFVADRGAVRKLIALIILFWSACTALTATAWSFTSMIVVRLAFGCSEAGLSPAVASWFRRSVEAEWRSSAFGMFLAGGRAGGILAPGVTALIALRYGWRAVFYFFGALGLVVLGVWLATAPQDAPGGNDLQPSSEVRRLSISPSFVALVVVAVLYTMSWQFYVTWFPTYLMEQGASLARTGAYAGLPFLFGLTANAVGGLASDATVKLFGLKAGRRLFVTTSLLVSASLMFAGPRLGSKVAGAIVLALAAGAGDLVLGTLWASAVDEGGSSAGTVAGAMNSASNLGAIAAPVLIGRMLHIGIGWYPILTGAASINVAAAFAWLLVKPSPIRNEVAR
jgi:MFS family permease